MHMSSLLFCYACSLHLRYIYTHMTYKIRTHTVICLNSCSRSYRMQCHRCICVYLYVCIYVSSTRTRMYANMYLCMHVSSLHFCYACSLHLRYIYTHMTYKTRTHTVICLNSCSRLYRMQSLRCEYVC
jgi:hypothetical protein